MHFLQLEIASSNRLDCVCGSLKNFQDSNAEAKTQKQKRRKILENKRIATFGGDKN